MARGKQSALSARRQVESAHQVIDRLTSELAEAKYRARQAESRAADADRLRQLLHEHNNDDLLADALTTIDDWRRIAREDRERRLAGLSDVRRLLDDLQGRGLLATVTDRIEFFERRYPKLAAAIYAGESNARGIAVTKATPLGIRKRSDDEIRRFQRLAGLRGVFQSQPDRDMADVVADALDAQQIAVTRDEFYEYIGLSGDKASA